MANENDLNKNQPVTDTSLTGQAATGQDLNQPVTEKQAETLADGTDANKTVPYTELKKATEAKNEAERKLQEQEQLHQNQMALMNQQAAPQQTQTQPLSDYDQAKTDLGLANTEFVTESERSAIHTRMTELMNIRTQHNNAAFSNQQFESSHSDFASVVGIRNPGTGQIQPTAEISKILTEKPYLSAAAFASSQGAYEIVMSERKLAELAQQNTVNEEHLQQQGIDNRLAPVSGAAAASGAVPAKAGSITLEQQQENERKVATGEFN